MPEKEITPDPVKLMVPKFEMPPVPENVKLELLVVDKLPVAAMTKVPEKTFEPPSFPSTKLPFRVVEPLNVKVPVLLLVTTMDEEMVMGVMLMEADPDKD